MRHNFLPTVAVFVLVAASLVLPSYALIRINEVQLRVTCISAQTNIDQLKAIQQNQQILRSIAADLGLPTPLPVPFDIPEIPEECK